MTAVRFGSLFTFIRNGLNVRQQKTHKGIPISRIETISNATIDGSRVGYADLTEAQCAGWLLHSGDILFSHINSVQHIGKCALYRGTPAKLVHGMNLLCLRPDTNKLVPEFASHLIRTKQFRSKLSPFINKAVNQACLSIGSLKWIEVDVPPLQEQRRIAAILDKAGELRAKRRAALEQLNRLTQSVFLEMFGDPATNPKGWPRVELGEVVKVVGGYGFRSEDFTAEGNAVVRISNLTGDGIDLTDIARIPDDKLGKGASFKIHPGDVLIAMSGATTGKLGVVPAQLEEELFQNQRVGNFRIRDAARIQREFLLGLLRSKFYQRFLWQLAAGVAQPNVSGWQLESAVAPLPSIEMQRDFARRLGLMDKMKSDLRKSLVELDGLFDSLQHRASIGAL